jgi:thioredoxin-like negative regulator of GroEL
VVRTVPHGLPDRRARRPEHARPPEGRELNTDEAPDIAGRYDVQGIPLLVLITDGREADRLVGAVPEAKLRRWVDEHVPDAAGAETH